ncbi:MAG: GspH/FimT family protein, partial [Halioglobus sp.]
RTEARRLLSAIHLARREAIQRNVPVTLCPSAMVRPGEAECDGVYADGWIMFSNRARDRVVDADDELIKVFNGLPPGYSLTNRAATRDENQLITYYPDGTAHRNRTLMICSRKSADIPSWSVILNIVGRPRIARDWGDCPSP